MDIGAMLVIVAFVIAGLPDLLSMVPQLVPLMTPFELVASQDRGKPRVNVFCPRSFIMTER